MLKRLMPYLLEFCRFGAVGFFVSLINYFGVVGLVQFLQIPPLRANLIVFCVAVVVSFLMHKRFTFQSDTSIKAALPKFAIISLATLGIMQLWFYILLSVFNIYYAIALIIVLATIPPIKFAASKAWVF